MKNEHFCVRTSWHSPYKGEPGIYGEYKVLKPDGEEMTTFRLTKESPGTLLYLEQSQEYGAMLQRKALSFFKGLETAVSDLAAEDPAAAAQFVEEYGLAGILGNK